MTVKEGEGIAAEDLDLISETDAADAEADALWAEMASARTAAPASDAGAQPAAEEPQDDSTEEPETDGTPAAAAETSTDADAETLRRQHAALAAETAAIEHRMRSDEGRLRSHRARIAELQRQIEGRPSDDSATTKFKAAREKLAAATAEYPEVGQPIAEAMDALDQQVSHVTAAEQGRRQAAQNELVSIIRTETARLTEAVPDWQDLVRDQAFYSWVEDQPRRFRDALHENAADIVNATSAIDLLTAWKAHVAAASQQPPAPQPAPAAATQQPTPQPSPPPQDKRRERQLAGATAPTGTTRAPVTSGIPAEGDPDLIWQQLAAKRDAEKARHAR